MLLDLTKRQDPTLLILFRSVLDLACQLNPTVLRLAAKSGPTTFDRENNSLNRNSWLKTQEKNTPQDATVLSTIQILYDYIVVHWTIYLYLQ
jgi:hypothetical protein